MAMYPTTEWAKSEHREWLNGATVCDRDGNKIGTVKGVFVEGNAGTARYLSIATGWFGTKEHVVPLDDVEYAEDDEKVILPYGRDQLESAPTYDDVTDLTDADEQSIYSYYGREGYWESVRAKQTTPAPTPEIAEADVAAAMSRGEDPLRTDIPSNRGHEGRIADDELDDDTYRTDALRSRGVRRYDW